MTAPKCNWTVTSVFDCPHCNNQATDSDANIWGHEESQNACISIHVVCQHCKKWTEFGWDGCLRIYDKEPTK